MAGCHRNRWPDASEWAALFQELSDLGVQETAASRIVESFNGDRIKRNVAYALEQREKGGVTRLAAYVVKAIQEDYRPAPTREELEKLAAAKSSAERNRLSEADAAREQELRSEFEKYREQRTRKIFASRPAEWQAARRKAYEDELMARPQSDIWRPYFEEKGWDHAFVSGTFFGELQKELLTEPHEVDFEAFKQKSLKG